MSFLKNLKQRSSLFGAITAIAGGLSATFPEYAHLFGILPVLFGGRDILRDQNKPG